MNVLSARLAVALAAAGCAAVLPATASAGGPSTCGYAVTDSAGYLWESNDDGSVDADDNGEVGGGDTFDGTGRLTVDADGDDSFVEYGDDARPDCTVDDVEHVVTYSAQDLEGLSVAREVKFNLGPQRFARLTDRITNPSDEPVTVTVGYTTNYGSDSSTVIRATSSGDDVFAPGDRWLTGSQDNQGDTEYATLLDGAGALDAWDRFDPSGDEPTDGGFRALYDDVTIPAGGTATYLHFEHAVEDDTNAASLQFAKALESGGDPVLYAGLTDTDLETLRNWGEDVDADGVKTVDDNCVAVKNPDQADLDKDGRGDACDDDVDGDGVDNAIEAQLGTSPRSADSDGDGFRDGGDSCPALAGPVRGCPAPVQQVLTAAPSETPLVRALPAAVTLRSSARRGENGLTVKSSGRIGLPQGLTAAACDLGRVAIVVRHADRTVSTRVAQVRKDCTYGSSVTFRRLSAKKVQVQGYFFGSRGLVGRSAKSLAVTVK